MSSSQKERGWGNQLLTIIEGNEGKKKGVVISPFFLSLDFFLSPTYTYTVPRREEDTHTHEHTTHWGGNEGTISRWLEPTESSSAAAAACN